MLSTLTEKKQNILDADVKTSSIWLFEIDINNDGTPEYYWSTQGYTYNGQAYTFKIFDHSDIILKKGNPEIGILPSSKITIKIANKNNVYTAASFKGASITIRWIAKAYLGILGGGTLTLDTDSIIADRPSEEEDEILAFTFRVKASKNIYEQISLECVDWFSEYLEGNNPITPYVSNLFPGDIMQSDNYNVPVVFGTGYFPLRWAFKWMNVIYVDADTFTILGDYTSLFSAGYWLWANCGVDGYKNCWILNSSYATGITTVNLTTGSDDLTSNLTQVYIDFYVLGISTPTYTIDRCKAPKESPGGEYLATDYTFKQDTISGSDGENYKIVRAIIDDHNNDGTYDANGYWATLGKQVYDTPFKLSRSDLSTMTDPANIIEYLLESWGIPSSQIDDISKAAATTIFTARGISLNIPLYYPMTREELLCKILTISGMILIIRDKIYFKVLTKTSQLTLETGLIDKLTFDVNISTVYTEKKKDSGYVIWQKSTDPIGQGYENKQLIGTKSTTANPSDTTIEAEWLSDDTGVKQQKAAKLALQRILLVDKDINFNAKNKIALLEVGDIITINPAFYDTDGTPYNVQIETMIFRKKFTGIEVEATRFSDSLDNWDDLSESSITIGAANTFKGYLGSLGDIRFDATYTGANKGDFKWGDYDNGKGLFWDQSAGIFDIKGQLNANDINAGVITGRTIQTTGTRLTQDTLVGDTIIYLADTSDFPSSGTAWINDSSTDVFTYTGKTATTLTGCSGVLAHSSGVAVGGQFRRMAINAEEGELHFYYDRGDTTVEELISLGIKQYGGDNYLAVFGSENSSRKALVAASTNNISTLAAHNLGSGVALYAIATSGTGLALKAEGGANAYGASLSSDISPLRLVPFSTIPTHSANEGSLGVKDGILYINQDGSTDWQRVANQLGTVNSTYTFDDDGLIMSPYQQGSMRFWPYVTDSLADDGTINLPDNTNGVIFVSCEGQAGMWLIELDGTVLKITGSTNTASTDSDGNLCVYDGGSTMAIVKNRLGFSAKVRIFYFYGV